MKALRTCPRSKHREVLFAQGKYIWSLAGKGKAECVCCQSVPNSIVLFRAILPTLVALF